MERMREMNFKLDSKAVEKSESVIKIKVKYMNLATKKVMQKDIIAKDTYPTLHTVAILKILDKDTSQVDRKRFSILRPMIENNVRGLTPAQVLSALHRAVNYSYLDRSGKEVTHNGMIIPQDILDGVVIGYTATYVSSMGQESKVTDITVDVEYLLQDLFRLENSEYNTELPTSKNYVSNYEHWLQEEFLKDEETIQLNEETNGLIFIG